MQHKLRQPIALLVAAALLAACTPENTQQMSQMASPVAMQQSLQPLQAQQTEAWAGVYRGELPCPNCDYIEAELALNPDLSYAFKSRNVGRVAGELPQLKRGVFHWREEGLVQLDAEAAEMVFFVGVGALEMRDNNGQAYFDLNGKSFRLQKTAAVDARK